MGQPRIDLGMSYQYWRDPSAQQTINEIVRRQYDPRWMPVVNEPPNFHYTHDAIWFRFALASDQTEDGDYLLELGTPFLDDVEMHHVKRNHFGDLYIAASYRTGDNRDVVLTPSPHRFPLFPVRVNAGASELVYVKVHSDSSINFPVHLWQRDAYIPQEQKAQAFYGFFFGLMVVMAFYNLVVWLFIKDPMYVCYFFYAMAVVFYQAAFSGFGALYLWGNINWLLDKSLVISSSLSFLFGGLFVWHFLSLKEQRVIYRKAVIATLWTFSGIFVTSLVLPENILAPVSQSIGIFACIALMIIGCLLVLERHEMARYFVVAWGVLLIGTVVHTLMMNGVLPRTHVTEYMQPVGMALEVMLLAVAMALRVKQERAARKKAVKTALELAQKVNAMNAEKLMLYSEDNQVLEEQAVAQDEQLDVMRLELDEVKERLDALTRNDSVEGTKNSATLRSGAIDRSGTIDETVDMSLDEAVGEVPHSDSVNVVNIEKGRKDSQDM